MADTWRVSGTSDTTVVSVADELESARQAARTALERWQQGERADAQAVLGRHPHLYADKSLVLDLVRADFWQRQAAGETLDPHEFARQFPRYWASLTRMLMLASYLVEKPALEEFEEPPWPELDSVFLGFPLLDELGRGAFAQVYLATEPKLANRLVALKVAPHGLQEAERLGKLRHPNIVPVYRVEQDPRTGLSAVCMPYLGRATLCDLLDLAFSQRPWPRRATVILAAARAHDSPSDEEAIDPWLLQGTYLDGVVRLVQQLAAALQYTHQAGIYHLDLKPSNVLLTPAGRPMLLDFNLSLDKAAAETRIGGTLPYMSPEQIRASVLGQDQAIDQRSDLFSLGVILYELICGSLPYGTPSWRPSPQLMGAALLEQQQLGPRPLAERCSGVDSALVRLVERCLAFDPAARPQTAGELANALAAQLGLMPRTRRWVRSHRRTVYTSILLTAALAGIAAGYIYTRDPYWVRMYHAGQQAFVAGKYDQAIDYLTQSAAEHPHDGALLVLRGQAHQKAGNYVLASEDYFAANELSPDPSLHARSGYCLSMADSFESAVTAYRQAIAGGFVTEHIWTNLGACYISRSDFDRAAEAFSHAIALNPQSGLAFLGRAKSELDRPDGPHPPKMASCLDDIDNAMKLLPASGELLGTAARLYALSGDPTRKDLVFVLLDRAIDQGFNPNRHLSYFGQVANDGRFASLCAESKNNQPAPINWFRDPLAKPGQPTP